MLRDAQKTLKYAHEREERSFIARQAAFSQIQQQDFMVREMQSKNLQLDSHLSTYLSQAMIHYNGQRATPSHLSLTLQSFQKLNHPYIASIIFLLFT
jgi:hypothetical protein